MAHLWVVDPSAVAAVARAWAVLELEGEPLRLAASPPERAGVSGGGPLLVRAAGPAGSESWAVLAGAAHAVAVNGLPVSVGIRVVADRDEIRVPGTGRFFFSSERLARPEPFPGGATPVFCPRCRKAIEAGSLDVRCPRCGVWHHHAEPSAPDLSAAPPSAAVPSAEALSCWTYAETCAMCDQPSALDAGYQWTPQGL